MEHFNPILGKETAGQKFITCGELILNGEPEEYLRNAAGSHGLED